MCKLLPDWLILRSGFDDLLQLLIFLFVLFLVDSYYVVFFLFLQILPQDLLKKYITYAKLNVFPRLHDSDMEKLTQVYAELRRESSVRFYFYCCLENFILLI